VPLSNTPIYTASLATARGTDSAMPLPHVKLHACEEQ
jgi:hypothetical protein